ncbi:MAG: hypothetical protein RLZZ483_1090, partial [Actinomycetota bacterium]
MDSNRKGFAENWGQWDKFASKVYRKGMEDLPFFDTEVKHSEVRATKENLRRSAVMRAGLEIFTEKGFHLASMDDIAERAG